MAKSEAEAQFELANALRQQGRFHEAAAGYRRVLLLRPDIAQAHNNLGITLKMLGRVDDAVASYRQALLVKPDFALAHNNLGNVYQELGQLDEAVASYRQALRFDPNLAAVHLNLGTTLRALGYVLAAIDSFRQVVRLQPRYAEGHVHLGSCLQEVGQSDQAEVAFRTAIHCDPTLAPAHACLGSLLADQGKADEALASLRQAYLLKPTDRARISIATCLPVIFQSAADLQAWRQRLVDEIRRLRVEGIVVDLTDEPADPLFFLAYQGLNDREIMRDYAGLFRAPDDGGIAKPQAAVRMPQAAVRMAQAAVRMPDRIRVGFVSTFFRTHTLGHWMRGLVTMLSRKEFDVTVLSIGHYEDDVANFIREHAEHYVEVPRMVAAARRLIAEQQLDVLFYTDIGLEPITYSLAFSRLAPLQCVTLGHPVTTGIDTIDYYISVEDLETSECSSHYTEKLALLKTLPIHYYRPQPRAPFRDRGHFGLAQEDHVYACLQSPFKFHPDFDELLGGILGGDPLGKLVLTRSLIPHWENLLRQRFATTLPDVVDRIRFLPMMDYNDYLQLLSLADVQLDPLQLWRRQHQLRRLRGGHADRHRSLQAAAGTDYLCSLQADGRSGLRGPIAPGIRADRAAVGHRR